MKLTMPSENDEVRIAAMAMGAGAPRECKVSKGFLVGIHLGYTWDTPGIVGIISRPD